MHACERGSVALLALAVSLVGLVRADASETAPDRGADRASCERSIETIAAVASESPVATVRQRFVAPRSQAAPHARSLPQPGPRLGAARGPRAP